MKNLLVIIMCLIFAILSQILSKYIGGSYMLYALFIGILLSSLLYNEKTKQGVDYTGKKILRIGVALLGARITFNEMSILGFDVLFALVLSVFVTIFFGIVVARLIGLDSRIGTISGGAVAICGASAAMAVSSIFPHNKRIEKQTLFVIVAVNILSTIAMVLYPLIIKYMEYNSLQAGVFLGGSIHDVAQVVGAGLSISEKVGDIATITKLFRVAMLLPVVFLLAIIMALVLKNKSQDNEINTQTPLPTFLIVFIILVGFNSFDLLLFELPAINWQINTTLSFISKILLTMAVFALGLKTSFKDIFNIGYKYVLLIILETIFIAILVLLIATHLVI
jgi:uncharacterized integral membrane protein (TIGR00698 family)